MFILYLLASCFAQDIKSFEVLFLVKEEGIEECNQFKSQVSTLRTTCKDVPESDKNYADCQVLHKLYDVKCAVANSVNEELQNVKAGLDQLLVFADAPNIPEIDFSKLPDKMIVILSPSLNVESSGANVLELIKKLNYRKASKQSADRKANIKATPQSITIAGAITDKVSFLSITPLDSETSISLTISQADLNVENLYLANTEIASSSKNIASKYLYDAGGNTLTTFAASVENLMYYSTNAAEKITFLASGGISIESSTDEGGKTFHGVISTSCLEYTFEAVTDAEQLAKSINITVYDVGVTPFYEYTTFNEKLLLATGIKIITTEWTDVTVPSEFKINIVHDDQYNIDKTGFAYDAAGSDDVIVENNLFQYAVKDYSGPADDQTGGETPKKYGYSFDLSDVSSTIKVYYYRTDRENDGKREAVHEIVTIGDGDRSFDIHVYATIEGKCTQGYIASFTAGLMGANGYPSRTVTDTDFATCPNGDDPLGGDQPEIDPPAGQPDGRGEANDLKNIQFKTFDLMFVMKSEKMDECNELKSDVNEVRGLCSKITEEDEEYVDCQILGKLNNIYCPTPDKVNEELGNLNGVVDFLAIELDDDPTEPIDFNKMNGQKVVLLTSDSGTVHTGANILDKIKMIFNRPIRKAKPSNAKPKAGKNLYVNLVGGIKEHVSFLYLFPIYNGNNLIYNITGSKLDIENLYLEDSEISKDSESIDVTYLYNSINNGGENVIKKLKSKQLTSIIGSHNTLNIQFNKDFIAFTDPEKQEFGNWEPSSITDTYGIISETKKYHIKAPPANAVVKTLNITVSNIYNTFYEFVAFFKFFILEGGEKQKITLTSDLWPADVKIPEGFKINVICDTNKFDVVTDKLDEKLKSLVVQKEPLKYEERGTGESNKKKKGLSAGAIAGIVIACVVVVGAVVGVLVWYFVFHKKSVGNSASESA